jgi:integrase
MLAILFGCGLRRSELVGLELDEVQMRQGHWAVVDLIGKGGHIRTVPIPEWVKAALDQWTGQPESRREGHRSQSLRRCSEAGASRGDAGSHAHGQQIQQPSDLWDLEHYLTERRREIDRKYDYRYSNSRTSSGNSCKNAGSGKTSCAAWGKTS